MRNRTFRKDTHTHTHRLQLYQQYRVKLTTLDAHCIASTHCYTHKHANISLFIFFFFSSLSIQYRYAGMASDDFIRFHICYFPMTSFHLMLTAHSSHTPHTHTGADLIHNGFDFRLKNHVQCSRSHSHRVKIINFPENSEKIVLTSVRHILMRLQFCFLSTI